MVGEPTDIEGARQLATEDPFQFQAWVLGLVGARVAGSNKKGADKGIDGRLYFHDEPVGGKTKQILISVKGGHVTVTQVGELIGVMKREGAEMGVFLSFEEPTQPMRSEAAQEGRYQSPWGKHPRLQLLTVRELLNGAKLDYPPAHQSNVTFKHATKAEEHVGENLELPLADDSE